MKHLPVLLIITAIAFLVVTRFINLSWGSPYFFHPDERNIASSVSQLALPTQLNPKFFAYGSLPIYLIFFLGLPLNVFSSCDFSLASCHVPFDQAIIISRLLSALFSCLSVLLIYKIAHLVWSRKTAIFLSFLSIFSTGFIQFSHFGTYEMWTIFFSLLLCYYSVHFLTKQVLTTSLIMGVVTGILIAIKISNLVFLPLTVFVVFIAFLLHLKKHTWFKTGRHVMKHTILLTLISLVVYVLTNPFVFLSQEEFLGSFRYEKTVATGELPVFYTQEFTGTIPILYQFIHVFPFLLNPVITLVFPVVMLSFGFFFWKKNNWHVFLLGVFFLVSFLPQAILFIKWTRNSVIAIPYLLLLLPVTTIFFHPHTVLFKVASVFIMLSSMFFSLGYFGLTYLAEDTRVVAARKASEIIPNMSPMISEVYDMGIVPFNEKFPRITLVNTYDMEHDPLLSDEFHKALLDAEYIILPSHRVSKTRLARPDIYPKGHDFYRDLTLNKHHYALIYQTSCDLLCNIVYVGDPMKQVETTAVVFDRPIVRIYKKI